jgi:HEAT repeat protein
MQTKRGLMLALIGVWPLMLGCSGNSTNQHIAQLGDGDPKVRRAAVRALREQKNDSAEAVTALAGACKDQDLEVREIAVAALGRFGAAAKPSEPALAEALRDPEISVRLGAAKALQKIDPESQNYVPVILDSLSAGHGTIFLDVGQMGADAKWAIPTLDKLLSHQQAGIRALAARTLGQIGVATSEATAALTRSLRDTDPVVRKAAQHALAQLGSKDAAAP